MNKDRRKQIDKIIADLEKLGPKIEAIKSEIDDLSQQLESIKDEEQDYYDNMPEGLQQSDKGTQAEEAISLMENVVETLAGFGEGFDVESMVTDLDNAKQ